MGETNTKPSDEIKRKDEKVDLRKHRKRITTPEEKQEIMETRKKIKDQELREKMQRISDQQNDRDNGIIKKKTKVNNIGYQDNDPYGLAEAWWIIFTKPKDK